MRRHLLLGVSTTGELGVDLEEVREDLSLIETARVCFRPDELELLERLPATCVAPAFFRLWTLKEAAAKTLGRNLAWGLSGAALTLDAAGRVSRVRVQSSGLHAWMTEGLRAGIVR